MYPSPQEERKGERHQRVLETRKKCQGKARKKAKKGVTNDTFKKKRGGEN